MPIKFGTDGWRDIIAEDFTYANLRLVAQAHAQMLRASGGDGVVVGFDPRFQGHNFARVVAETMAQQGLNVWLAGAYLPTPALSFAALHLGAAGGVMITASHNPPIYNGYKLKGPYGGSATPEMVARVEAALERPEPYSGPAGKIQPLDIREAYFEQLDRQLDLPALRAYRGRVYHDAMGGAAAGWLSAYVRSRALGFELREVRGQPDPLFGGVNPEPIVPNLGALMDDLGRETGRTFAVVTDGDADRVGAVTAGGQFFNSHQIFAVFIKHLYGRGLRGRVVKTVSGSRIIELLTRKLGLELLETPVGFKYITDAFLEGQADPARAVMIGGEESGGLSSRGHIPERDGLLNSLLLIEAVAMSGKSLGSCSPRSKRTSASSTFMTGPIFTSVPVLTRPACWARRRPTARWPGTRWRASTPVTASSSTSRAARRPCSARPAPSRWCASTWRPRPRRTCAPFWTRRPGGCGRSTLSCAPRIGKRAASLGAARLVGAGGTGGIRTLDKLAPIHAFQACSFNHSDTVPAATKLARPVARMQVCPAGRQV